MQFFTDDSEQSNTSVESEDEDLIKLKKAIQEHLAKEDKFKVIIVTLNKYLDWAFFLPVCGMLRVLILMVFIPLCQYFSSCTYCISFTPSLRY